MDKYMEILDKYDKLNKVANGNGIVFFGEDWLYELPVAEVVRDSGIDTVIYNRSIQGLFIENAHKVINTCICALCPSKVFINVGENDIKKSDFNSAEFCEKYEWLLYTIHSKCNCRIYILSITGDKSDKANHLLKKIAEKYECEYVDIQNCESSFLKFFSKIKFFLRSHPITFCDAVRM